MLSILPLPLPSWTLLPFTALQSSFQIYCVTVHNDKESCWIPKWCSQVNAAPVKVIQENEAGICCNNRLYWMTLKQCAQCNWISSNVCHDQNPKRQEGPSRVQLPGRTWPFCVEFAGTPGSLTNMLGTLWWWLPTMNCEWTMNFPMRIIKP